MVALQEAFLRIHDTATREIQSLFRADGQFSRVWFGTAIRACWQCEGIDCPSCGGTGKREIKQQCGVSVVPNFKVLQNYCASREMRFSESVVLLRLRGHRLPEPDVDAKHGAILIRPTELIQIIELTDLGATDLAESLNRLRRSFSQGIDW